MSTPNTTKPVSQGRPRPSGRPYAPAERAEAIACYRQGGLTYASKQTGVAIGTVKRWVFEDGATPEYRQPRQNTKNGHRIPFAPLLARFRNEDELRLRCSVPKGSVEQWRADGIPFYKADRICCKVLRVPMVDLWPDHYPAVTTSEDDVWCAVWAAGGDPEASPEDWGPWIDAAVQTVVQPRLAFEMAS